MNKFIITIILIALGFFYVLVLNNRTVTKQTNSIKTANTISVPASAVPSPTASIKPTNKPLSPTASSSPSQATQAVIATTKGNITLTLFPQDAPKTVANFATKAKSGFYNNLTFHRVEDWVIQGGDPKGNGTGGGQMPTELNKKPFVIGSMGVARGTNINISNDAQFFITKTNASWLNGQYTNFGIVTNGMNVVNKIKVGDKILGITIN